MLQDTYAPPASPPATRQHWRNCPTPPFDQQSQLNHYRKNFPPLFHRCRLRWTEIYSQRSCGNVGGVQVPGCWVQDTNIIKFVWRTTWRSKLCAMWLNDWLPPNFLKLFVTPGLYPKLRHSKNRTTGSAAFHQVIHSDAWYRRHLHGNSNINSGTL